MGLIYSLQNGYTQFPYAWRALYVLRRMGLHHVTDDAVVGNRHCAPRRVQRQLVSARALMYTAGQALVLFPTAHPSTHCLSRTHIPAAVSALKTLLLYVCHMIRIGKYFGRHLL